MENKEVFDGFSASGSTEIKFNAGMYKNEEIKQENFDGWDAAAWIMNLFGICVFHNYFIHMALLWFIILYG